MTGGVIYFMPGTGVVFSYKRVDGCIQAPAATDALKLKDTTTQ